MDINPLNRVNQTSHQNLNPLKISYLGENLNEKPIIQLTNPGHELPSSIVDQLFQAPSNSPSLKNRCSFPFKYKQSSDTKE